MLDWNLRFWHTQRPSNIYASALMWLCLPKEPKSYDTPVANQGPTSCLLFTKRYQGSLELWLIVGLGHKEDKMIGPSFFCFLFFHLFLLVGG